MEQIARDIKEGIFPKKSERWRIVEKRYCFEIRCERARPHIIVSYGDTPYNIPNYGTKDQAYADAKSIAKALNERDSS